MKILTNTRAAMSGIAVAALAAGGVVLGAAPAQAASTSTWDQLAQCESSGNWAINTGNGYYGGLQFSMATWLGHGGTGSPAAASKATQIQIAERVLASQGWGAWPACSAQLGLRGGTSSVSAAVAAAETPAAPAPKAVASEAAPARVSHAAKASHAKHRGAVKRSGRSYTVQRGDTLSTIAAKVGVKGGWGRLADVNHLSNPNLIYVGQHLHLPA